MFDNIKFYKKYTEINILSKQIIFFFIFDIN